MTDNCVIFWCSRYFEALQAFYISKHIKTLPRPLQRRWQWAPSAQKTKFCDHRADLTSPELTENIPTTDGTHLTHRLTRLVSVPITARIVSVSNMFESEYLIILIWVSFTVRSRSHEGTNRTEPNRTEASPVSMRWRKNSWTGRTCVLVASGKDRSSTTKRTAGKVLDSVSESSTPSFSWKDLDATRFGLNESEAEGKLRQLRAPLAALKTRLKALTAPLRGSTSPLCSSRALWQRSSNSKFSWKIFGEVRQCNRRLASLEP